MISGKAIQLFTVCKLRSPSPYPSNAQDQRRVVAVCVDNESLPRPMGLDVRLATHKFDSGLTKSHLLLERIYIGL
jgi:hypothetical protein